MVELAAVAGTLPSGQQEISVWQQPTVRGGAQAESSSTIGAAVEAGGGSGGALQF